MSKHCVFKMLVMNEKNNEEKITEELSPRQRFYEQKGENLPSTSKQRQNNNSIDHSKSPCYEDVSLQSISSSSSTDLSSPPRAFPKRSKIVPEKKVTYKINIKKSRWEPISSGEERRRFESLKSKKVDKKTKKRKKTKGKRRKEMVNESHRDGDHFRPLKKFVSNRRKLATELLDSVDLETLYEIFPELEDKSDIEAHKIVYNILCGMSLKRILADLNGDDLPESSSESEENEYLSSNQEDNIKLNQSSNSSSESEEILQKSPKNDENDDKIFNEKEEFKNITIKIINRKKSKKCEEELEEGEICSNKMSISEEEESIKEMEFANKNVEEKKIIEEENEKFKNVLIEENKIKNIEANKINLEPTFIVSVDFSDKFNIEEELEDDNLSQNQIEKVNNKFEQRIVCVLPPSPTTSSLEIGEEEENYTNKKIGQQKTYVFIPSSPSNSPIVKRNELIIEGDGDNLKATDIDDVEDINFELVEN